jgi:hypothetical protein
VSWAGVHGYSLKKIFKKNFSPRESSSFQFVSLFTMRSWAGFNPSATVVAFTKGENPMIRIRTGDLILGLNDLFVNKIGLIQTLASFLIFGAPLDKKRSVLGSVYRGLTVTPFVAQLRRTDAVHDSAGRLLYMISDGFAQLVTLTEEQRVFWSNVRDTFIPSLSILKMSYPDEAAAATGRLKDLESMKSVLDAIQLPEKMTVYGLTAIYLQAGVSLGELISSRAGEEISDEAKRTKQLHVVRLETLGLLGRFREALTEEVKGNEKLPRDLPEQVFAYIDTLAAKRQGPRGESDEDPASDLGDDETGTATAAKA